MKHVPAATRRRKASWEKGRGGPRLPPRPGSLNPGRLHGENPLDAEALAGLGLQPSVLHDLPIKGSLSCVSSSVVSKGALAKRRFRSILLRSSPPNTEFW
ncbi:hypothetical protein XACLE3_9170007 [Xanthomonas citri pv. citri]|nr:hypothetical protein XACLE3_9170007 [Xanthomonas citri pv. citri]